MSNTKEFHNMKSEEIYDKYFEIVAPCYNPELGDDEFFAVVEELEAFLGMKLKNSAIERLRKIGQ